MDSTLALYFLALAVFCRHIGKDSSTDTLVSCLITLAYLSLGLFSFGVSLYLGFSSLWS